MVEQASTQSSTNRVEVVKGAIRELEEAFPHLVTTFQADWLRAMNACRDLASKERAAKALARTYGKKIANHLFDRVENLSRALQKHASGVCAAEGHVCLTALEGLKEGMRLQCGSEDHAAVRAIITEAEDLCGRCLKMIEHPEAARAKQFWQHEQRMAGATKQDQRSKEEKKRARILEARALTERQKEAYSRQQIEETNERKQREAQPGLALA